MVLWYHGLIINKYTYPADHARAGEEVWSCWIEEMDGVPRHIIRASSQAELYSMIDEILGPIAESPFYEYTIGEYAGQSVHWMLEYQEYVLYWITALSLYGIRDPNGNDLTIFIQDSNLFEPKVDELIGEPEEEPPENWYTFVEVEISGWASEGASPIDLTLEIYDNGVLVGSASEPAAVLGMVYYTSIILGSDAGNEAGLDMGEHTLQGKLTLSNEEGSVSYDTESITIGIGQVPTGDVT